VGRGGGSNIFASVVERLEAGLAVRSNIQVYSCGTCTSCGCAYSILYVCPMFTQHELLALLSATCMKHLIHGPTIPSS